ncbi:Alpha/Beta hydrolase protein [Mycena latifolia]|nr:Alpha/Beta hydrolase protein [Mycena latifolia]
MIFQCGRFQNCAPISIIWPPPLPCDICAKRSSSHHPCRLKFIDLHFCFTSPTMSNRNPLQRILSHAPWVPVYFGIAYGLSLFLILVPFVQTQISYGAHLGFSTLPNFSSPEDFGLAPGKAVNMYINAADNTTLGAWFVASEQYYRSLPFPAPPLDIRAAIKARPTILYLHGKESNRAGAVRVPVYSALSARLGANVLVIDYRGFGDSTGAPTLAGVAADARGAWDTLIALGAAPADILVMGHSLGCSVAGMLAVELGAEGVHPRGIALLAPFASMHALLGDAYLFGFLPLFMPLVPVPPLMRKRSAPLRAVVEGGDGPLVAISPIPIFILSLRYIGHQARYLFRFVAGRVIHSFDTLVQVPSISNSVLIAHSEDDDAVPHMHADMLFNAFLAPLLPPGQATRPKLAGLRKGIVPLLDIPAFGTLEEAEVGGRRVALLKTLKGTHEIGLVEGVQDVMGRMFGFI